VLTFAFTSSCAEGGGLACERMTRWYSRGRAALMRGFPNLSEIARANANTIRNINRRTAGPKLILKSELKVVAWYHYKN